VGDTYVKSAQEPDQASARSRKPAEETIGWREWVELPQLGIAQIKAKVDTGARTSAIHAFELVTEERQDGVWVRFGMHPDQRSEENVIWCEAPVKDSRTVRDSGGHEEERLVIETCVRLGNREWPIEATLTSRDNMGFRMLLGRTAIRGYYAVDPGRSYLIGKRKRKRA
jgi:hypothetical protein